MEDAVARRAVALDQGLATADDEQLVAACAEGQPEAFRELLARYRRSAVALAYQMLASVEDAEDIAQEAFVRVFLAIPQFRGQAAFSTWLYRIVTNLCLGTKRRSRPSVEWDAVAEPKAGESVSRSVTEGLLATQVLAEMPPGLRAILVLREQEGLTYREIADALGLPLGTVRSRLSKARIAFRRLWTQSLQMGEDQR